MQPMMLQILSESLSCCPFLLLCSNAATSLFSQFVFSPDQCSYSWPDSWRAPAFMYTCVDCKDTSVILTGIFSRFLVDRNSVEGTCAQVRCPCCWRQPRKLCRKGRWCQRNKKSSLISATPKRALNFCQKLTGSPLPSIKWGFITPPQPHWFHISHFQQTQRFCFFWFRFFVCFFFAHLCLLKFSDVTTGYFRCRFWQKLRLSEAKTNTNISKIHTDM